jgi:hypothetical protein
VANVRKECRFCPVDFRQRLGSPPLLFIGLGVRDCRGDLPGHEVKKAGVVVIEKAERVEAGNQKAGSAGLAAGQNGQHDGIAGWATPGTRGKVAAEGLRQSYD